MSKAESCNILNVYRLPSIVDNHALVPVADQVLAAGGNLSCVMDFTLSIHVDFRALRGFVRRIRCIGRLPKPILLVGLNPYCEEIVQFALSTADWDLFLELDVEMEAGVPGGNSALPAHGARFGSAGEPGARAAGPLLSPCPN